MKHDDLVLALTAMRATKAMSARQAAKLVKALQDLLDCVADDPATFHGYYELARFEDGRDEAMTHDEFLSFTRDLLEAAKTVETQKKRAPKGPKSHPKHATGRA